MWLNSARNCVLFLEGHRKAAPTSPFPWLRWPKSKLSVRAWTVSEEGTEVLKKKKTNKSSSSTGLQYPACILTKGEAMWTVLGTQPVGFNMWMTFSLHLCPWELPPSLSGAWVMAGLCHSPAAPRAGFTPQQEHGATTFVPALLQSKRSLHDQMETMRLSGETAWKPSRQRGLMLYPECCLAEFPFMSLMDNQSPRLVPQGSGYAQKIAKP